MSKKLNIKFIKMKFETENYELLTLYYKNNKQKLNYICPKGHRRSINWSDWQQGKRCLMCHLSNCGGENSYNYGRKFSIEHRKNISRAKKGKKHSEEAKRKMSEARKGKSFSKKHKEKISKSQKGENNSMYGKSGPLSPTWKGGVSCEPYCFEWSFKEFKEFIKERDSYKCLNPDCWKTTKRIAIHHIDYNKKNCKPQNLITLCRSCNSRANKDRKWHTVWYQTILNKRYGYEI